MMETEGCTKKRLMKATSEDLNNEIHDFTLEIITYIRIRYRSIVEKKHQFHFFVHKNLHKIIMYTS